MKAIVQDICNVLTQEKIWQGIKVECHALHIYICFRWESDTGLYIAYFGNISRERKIIKY